MIKITLSDLVDVVSKSGTPKATKVSQIKNREDYHPATDYYKGIRDAIADMHKSSKEFKELKKYLDNLPDKKKKNNYQEIVFGYKKWMGKKTISWFTPPRNNYKHSGIEVIINPELGLEFNGDRYIIKLYLKSDPLSKLKIDLITYLMNESLRAQKKQSDIVAILDVRNSKLFMESGSQGNLKAIVNAELAYVAALWENL